jgi:Ca2+-dependent lipid-binding protein
MTKCSDYVAEMRPFIKVFYRMRMIHKTRISTYSGLKPEWNETFEIIIDSLQDQLLFQVCEKDWTHEYILGDVTVPVSVLASHSGGIHWVSLYHNIHHTGDLLFWSKLSIKEDLPQASKNQLNAP